MGVPIFYVGIFCDSCGRAETGDVAAASQVVAEDGLRAELVAGKGWSCDAVGDLCAGCRAAAAGAPTGTPVLPSTGAPAPRRGGSPEVEALHAIDLVIGNADTLDAEAVGRVRGIVLDALNAWYARVEV